MRKIKVPFEKLRKQDYERYERVRMGGRFNMITEAGSAAAFAGLSIEKYMSVLTNYDKCMKKWPAVRGKE